MFKNIMLSFIALFAAVNPIALAAIFVSLTEHASASEKSKAIKQALITALCLSISFLFLGNLIFEVLHITFYDFLIAGGIILFCVAMRGIIRPGPKRHAPKGEGEGIGVTPLGTPLVAGPAFLTVSLITLGAFGTIATLVSIVANIIVVGIFFLASAKLLKLLGKSGTSALSKVANLLLASIAIMLIRKGVVFLIKQ